jgi:hypothetical protein
LDNYNKKSEVKEMEVNNNAFVFAGPLLSMEVRTFTNEIIHLTSTYCDPHQFFTFWTIQIYLSINGNQMIVLMDDWKNCYQNGEEIIARYWGLQSQPIPEGVNVDMPICHAPTYFVNCPLADLISLGVNINRHDECCTGKIEVVTIAGDMLAVNCNMEGQNNIVLGITPPIPLPVMLELEREMARLAAFDHVIASSAADGNLLAEMVLVYFPTGNVVSVPLRCSLWKATDQVDLSTYKSLVESLHNQPCQVTYGLLKNPSYSIFTIVAFVGENNAGNEAQGSSFGCGSLVMQRVQPWKLRMNMTFKPDSGIFNKKQIRFNVIEVIARVEWTRNANIAKKEIDTACSTCLNSALVRCQIAGDDANRTRLFTVLAGNMALIMDNSDNVLKAQIRDILGLDPLSRIEKQAIKVRLDEIFQAEANQENIQDDDRTIIADDEF